MTTPEKPKKPDNTIHDLPERPTSPETAKDIKGGVDSSTTSKDGIGILKFPK